MQTYQGYVTFNGGRLYYEVAGVGPPIVLIPGFGVDTRSWDEQVEAFAARHQVIRYDPRGFGRSSLPSGPYSMTDDLRALLDEVGVPAAHVIGLSRGGGVAIDFAIAYPDRTLSLIPVDSLLGGHSWRGKFGDDLSAFWAMAKKTPLDEVKRRWLDMEMFGTAQDKPTWPTIVQMVMDYSGWHWLNREPVIPLDPPAKQRLREITAPTLIIVGELDLPEFHEVADMLLAGIPRARKVVLPGVGHLSNQEDPASFNRTALDFVSGDSSSLRSSA